jgi:hypothetical protein
MSTVWAFEPIEELGGKTGMVQISKALAEELLKAGKVQDPRRGAAALSKIVSGPIKKKVVKKRKKKVVEDLDIEPTPKD